MDTLKKNNVELKEQLHVTDQQYKDLSKRYEKLLKRADYIWDVEQRFEKNMTQHYQNIGGEIKGIRQDISGVKDNLYVMKNVMDVRHEGVVARIEGNHAALLEKERMDFKHLEQFCRQLTKDIEHYYYKGLHPEQYEENIKNWYYKMTGECLDLENPSTFNEKIQWLKLNDSVDYKTRLADKYLVRDYVKEKIGEEYLIPLIGVYDNFDDINFAEMPNKFVMKANHASGWNIIVDDLNALDIPEARKKFQIWLNRNYAYYSGLELHYKNINPKIVIEQYIENDGHELFDYRFFCFSGKAYYIWVDVDSGKSSHRRNVYDLDWNLLPLQVNYPNDKNLDRKPKNLQKMIELAEKLSEGINFVRVDLYEVKDTIYFGEMTFTPQSGQATWDPPEYNKIYGDLLVLPNE